MSIRDLVLGAANSAGLDFAVYDRRDDEDLSWQQLEQAIQSGEVTVEEIAVAFVAALREALDLPD